MPKFAPGDYVVHPGQGLCSVEGVVKKSGPQEEDAASGASTSGEFYELFPVTGTRMRICYPVASEGQLLVPVAAREARELIKGMPAMDDDSFTDPHSWAVEEHFMANIRRGDCGQVLRTLKTMHDRMERAKSHGKKPSASYARIYKAAHERATAELGFALDAEPDRVDSMIAESFARAC